jgi:hypothetical protein
MVGGFMFLKLTKNCHCEEVRRSNLVAMQIE